MCVAQGLEMDNVIGRLVSEMTEHVITGGDRTDNFVGATRQLNCVELNATRVSLMRNSVWML